MELEKLFYQKFLENPEYYFDCGGRFEILGNHTDHNHGLCLAATANLSIKAVAKKTNSNHIVLVSQGFPVSDLDLDNLNYIENENKSASMIRGVAKYLYDKGYKIGGFNAYCSSEIYAGAGLSSSAAFELLIGKMFNELFNENKIPILELCQAGQFSENYYYGKNSGLLDQIGVGFGEISFIDFENINAPTVQKISFPFNNLIFITVNTGGDHSNLNHLYSSIPNDMFFAAKKLGHSYLRECNENDILNNSLLTYIEASRSKHFFDENKRVLKGINAIKHKNIDDFLQVINDSRISSTNLLKNMMVDNHYENSPLEACDYAMKFLKENGACKINGGGFAGSIICVVKDSIANDFIVYMQKKYGFENVKVIFIRNDGPISKKL